MRNTLAQIIILSMILGGAAGIGLQADPGDCEIIDLAESSYCRCERQVLPHNCSRGDVIEQCRENRDIDCGQSQFPLPPECNPGHCDGWGPVPIVDEPEPIDGITITVEDQRKTMVRHMAMKLYAQTGFGYDGAVGVVWTESKPGGNFAVVVERVLPTPRSCDNNTVEGCNNTGDDYDVCAGHGGIDEGLTEVGQDGWCWFRCADGAYAGISCATTIIDDPEPVGATEVGQVHELR